LDDDEDDAQGVEERCVTNKGTSFPFLGVIDMFGAVGSSLMIHHHKTISISFGCPNKVPHDDYCYYYE